MPKRLPVEDRVVIISLPERMIIRVLAPGAPKGPGMRLRGPQMALGRAPGSPQRPLLRLLRLLLLLLL